MNSFRGPPFSSYSYVKVDPERVYDLTSALRRGCESPWGPRGLRGWLSLRGYLGISGPIPNDGVWYGMVRGFF